MPMAFEFDQFKRNDGSIDLVAAFHQFLSLLPANSPKRIVSAAGLDLLTTLDKIRPITDPQVAALSLAHAMML